jgi:transmembrane sensor
MPPNRSLLDQLFRKFSNGKASPEERSLFWKWLWGIDARENKRSFTAKETEDVRARIWGHIVANTQTAAVVKGRFVWRPYAIVAVLMIGLLLTAWLLLLNNRKKEIAGSPVIINNGNTIRHLLLPDSTQVILNTHSSIEYSAIYNKQERRIILKGEGYFKVHKDSTRPFIVQTGQIETHALGTALNVEAREAEAQIRVALTEGKIAISPANDPSQRNLLLPGQILFYDKATQQFTTNHYTTDVTAWTRGGLVFNSIPLTEALDRLASRYQLQVQYNRKALQGKTITASFGNIGWKDVLANILLLHDLKYQAKDGRIIIQ